MSFRNFLSLTAVVASLSASAAGFVAGQGVANDHATGANNRDVTFVVRGGGNGYGYRQYNVPIGLTVLAWACPNFESSVYGLRLNLGWERYEGTWGLDTGLFSHSNDFGGIAANVFGNWTDRAAYGFQSGLVNYAGEMRGIQVGAVNLADHLSGVQIGFLNFNRAAVTLPLINVGW